MTDKTTGTSFPHRRESMQAATLAPAGVVDPRLRGDDVESKGRERGLTQRQRLSAGGLIDRNRDLAFTFDGHNYTGHPGDTLASALLANGVHLVARSFKYHRPRGIL